MCQQQRAADGVPSRKPPPPPEARETHPPKGADAFGSISLYDAVPWASVARRSVEGLGLESDFGQVQGVLHCSAGDSCGSPSLCVSRGCGA